jgi:hypothetical protein
MLLILFMLSQLISLILHSNFPTMELMCFFGSVFFFFNFLIDDQNGVKDSLGAHDLLGHVT